MSKADQSVPGPSHAGISSQVVADTVTTTSTVTPHQKRKELLLEQFGNEVEVEENKMVSAPILCRIFRSCGELINVCGRALGNLIGVLDDTTPRGFPIYEKRRAQRHHLLKLAVPEIVDCVQDEEMSTTPEPPVAPPRSVSSQFAAQRKSRPTGRQIRKSNDSTSGRKKCSKTKRHRCNICRKNYSTKSSLTSHHFTHLTEEEKTVVKQGWRHVCFFCQKRFSAEFGYHTHLVTHTMEKPFRCDQCGKQYAQKGQLKEHQRSHSANPRPFNCEECDKALSTKRSLFIHKKMVHQKLKDVDCPQCPKKFSTKGKMVVHMNGVHLKIPHLCPHCNKSFTQKGNVQTHVKNFHP